MNREIEGAAIKEISTTVGLHQADIDDQVGGCQMGGHYWASYRMIHAQLQIIDRDSMKFFLCPV